MVKKILLTILYVFAPRNVNRACIFMYHSVGIHNASFTVTPTAFEVQLSFLKRKNYKVVMLSELARRLKNNEDVLRNVTLTFDDGYIDNYEIVFPLIKKYAVPITIFLTTGNIGKSTTGRSGEELHFLTEDQIREMKASGLIEFFPHGEHHTKLHTLSLEEARKEILDSLLNVEKIIGPSARLFAYPSGRYTAETVKILEEENFVAAVTVKPGLARYSTPLLEMPRNNVEASTSLAEFRARTTKAGEWYEKLKVWN